MGQPSSKRRRALFWVGVVLLSISALWWILLIVSGGDTDDTVITGVITTIVPVGIGIYGIWRGRETPAADVQRRIEHAIEPVRETQQSVGLIKKGTFWVGLLFILFGIPIIWLGLDPAGLSLGWDLTDKDLGGGLLLIGTGLFPVLIGIWFMGITTRVTFNQPPGYMTVTLGHIPVFLWFLRVKSISREDLQNSTVTGHPLVKIVMKSGKELKLWTWRFDEAETLAQRIREFS